MSDQIEVGESFDPTKNIENLQINTSYIAGLEEAMIFFIGKLEDPKSVLPMFEKFEKYVEGKLDLTEDPFTHEERSIYTIFSLQQYIKAKAYEQVLNVKVPCTVNKDDIQGMLAALMTNDFDKMKTLRDKMQKDLNKSTTSS